MDGEGESGKQRLRELQNGLDSGVWATERRAGHRPALTRGSGFEKARRCFPEHAWGPGPVFTAQGWVSGLADWELSVDPTLGRSNYPPGGR